MKKSISFKFIPGKKSERVIFFPENIIARHTVVSHIYKINGAQSAANELIYNCENLFVERNSG